MTQNLLANETSPYLLQHRDNPVHWQAWNADSLALARREGKPILLSVGYAACHWCHVMAHESFENDDIAQVMNELFVNIKVDREERPDLDLIYQTALSMMGEQGGWPLTMFLTPDAEPFWGGTYFPATPRFGRPAFPQLLQGIAETYRTETDKVLQNVAALRDGLAKVARPPAGEDLSIEVLDTAAAHAVRMVDPVRGGTTGAPKFPQPSFFRFLWRTYRRTAAVMFRDAVTVTLDNICQGGIYDHLGGGFSRYATDPVWLVPHFEKMLYDNALLVDLLTEAWQETTSPLYATRVRETIEWVLRDLRTGDGNGGAFGLAGAFDADSEGVEGKFYVWTADEIDALLEADAEAFKQAYDIRPDGNWEGNTILNRSHTLALADDDAEATLARCRETLLAVRAKRIPPQRDDKVLADWNGLMIAALANAGAAFDRPDWIEAAQSVFSFVHETMSDGTRLYHTWCAGRPAHAAVLDDYANMSRAALILAEVTGLKSYIDLAETWVEAADSHFWDGADGGYFLSADDTDDVISRSKTIADNAVPSGNGTMVEVLARLFHVTGKTAYRDRAEDLIRALSGGPDQHLVNYGTMLAAYELLDRAVQVVVIGPPADPATDALLRTAFTASLPNRVLTRLAPDTPLPEGHPAYGKGQIDGAPTAYVCVGPTCGLPVTDPEALGAALANG